MPRLKPARRLKLEAFWRAHLKGWRDSHLNQREYCELHGLPLKRFGNWRAELKHEETFVPVGLLWRRGDGDQPRLKPRRREIHLSPRQRRRTYTEADKLRIIKEAACETASVSGVARKYGISTSLLFQWRKKLGLGPMHRIVPVTISDRSDGLADLTATAAPSAPEPQSAVIEIALAGGHHLRLAVGTDPAMVQRLVSALEGGVQ